MALFVVKLLPLILSFSFLVVKLKQQESYQTGKLIDSINNGSLSEKVDVEGTRYTSNSHPAEAAEKYEGSEPSGSVGCSTEIAETWSLGTVVQVALYPLLFLYDWVILPFISSNYVSSLWTVEAFFIVFLPYSASFIAVIICLFYIHVLGGTPVDVRPSHPEDVDDTLSEMFSSFLEWLCSLFVKQSPAEDSSGNAHEQKPQASDTETRQRTTQKLYNNSDSFELPHRLGGETSWRVPVSKVQHSDSFDLFLKEKMETRKKMKNKELLEAKHASIPSKKEDNTINHWKMQCERTPPLALLVYFRALRSRLSNVIFIHTSDVIWPTPSNILHFNTTKTCSQHPGGTSSDTRCDRKMLDFYTFAVLSAYILGPHRGKSLVSLRNELPQDRRLLSAGYKYDVVLLSAVFKRISAESSRSSRLDSEANQELD